MERERERRMMFATIASWVAKKSIIVVIAKPKRVQLSASLRRTHNHNISLDTVF